MGPGEELVWLGTVTAGKRRNEFNVKFTTIIGRGHAEQVIRKHLENATKELNGE
jgi:hypothetical protein